MAITVERSKELEKFPGEWVVVDHGLCWSRHDTEAEAEIAAEAIRRSEQVSEMVDERLDGLREEIMEAFEMSSDEALQAIKDCI